MKAWIITLSTACLSLGCQREVKVDRTSDASAATGVSCPEANSACPSDADAQSTPSPKLSCAALGIPSWESTLQELSEFRCVRCHNETFAWKGVLLTSYANFSLHQKAIKQRTTANAFTEPLDPLEQQTILAFIANGLPEKESDCPVSTAPTHPLSSP